ncbi:MAG: hypothetical protein COA77_10505 [Thaumarchaeota archaeon]|nr:MAG: hypothetical protein COA77_10505 [Nitrososphaerota archaeon]
MNLGIKYNILSENAHNKDFQDIADSIFKIGLKEKGILHTVANKGPMILTSISNKTKNLTRWQCTRWAAKRRIEGTPKTLGLIPNEYLIPKEHENRIRGKNGKQFHLSTKGLFAVLSTGIKLEQIYIYKEFVKFLRKQVAREIINHPNPKQVCNPSLIADLFIDFIKNQIHLFLIWHESAGINVARIKTFQDYLMDFYSKVDESFYSKFYKVDKSKENFYKQLLQKNFIITKTIHALDKIALPTINFRSEDNNVNQFFLDRITMAGNYVWKWPYYMEKMQFARHDENNGYSNVPDFIYQPPTGLEIGNYINVNEKNIKFFDIVKEELEELGIKKDYSNNVLNYIWDKSHTKFETVEATTFQVGV